MFFPLELSTILVFDRSNAPSWSASALWGRNVLSLPTERNVIDIKVEVHTQSGSSSIVFRCSWNLQINARFSEWRETGELEESP